MDVKIFKSIIENSNIPLDNKTSKELESAKKDEKFPVTKNLLIDYLSKNLTRLLTYKVSPEAYQRYSVRLHIIDTLRDWSRINGDLGKLPVFQNNEQSYKFLIDILKKYLSEEIICDCDDVNTLIQLAEVLFNSPTKNKLLTRCSTKVIERILNLEQSEKSEQFLQYVIEKSDDLKVESSLIEKIYITQKSLFIEKPITNCFNEYCSDQNKQDLFDKLNSLFEKVIDSPSLFQLVANQLKEIFVMTKYAKISQDFIQKILEKIQIHCTKYNKDMLDLYPTRLQYCVILLRIEPCHHTEDSKNYTVKSLKEIFLKNNDDALILISHFSDWLPDYLKFFDIIADVTQRTESTTQTNIEMSD